MYCMRSAHGYHLNAIGGKEYDQFLNTSATNHYNQNVAPVLLKTNDLPSLQTHALLRTAKYTIMQLKQLSKQYNLKISGTKIQLIHRIYKHLYLGYHATQIQTAVRRFLVRKYNKLHGPAHLKRSQCINHTDFISMEPVNEINYHQFISYTDDDGFTYGFDIASIYNVQKHHNKTQEIQNPYNRSLIPREIVKNIKRIIRIGKALKLSINLSFNNTIEMELLSEEKKLELRTLKLFQTIDSLGNYTKMNWFLELPIDHLIVYVNLLRDIWDTRSRLQQSVKRKICPCRKGPFKYCDMPYLIQETNIWNVRRMILDVMERFINHGVDNDHKILGAHYVLGALTMVSSEAAFALPWLYTAFVD